MCNSPTRGVGIMERGAGIPVPAVVSVVHALPQTLTSIPSNRGAAEMEKLAPSAPLITSQKKISDLIRSFADH